MHACFSASCFSRFPRHSGQFPAVGRARILAVGRRFLAVVVAGALAVLGFQSATAAGDPDAELAAIEVMREASLEAARQPLKDLAGKYRDALEKKRAVAQEGGDLERLMAVKEELALLDAGDSSAPPPKVADLAKLRQVYREQQAKLAPQVDTAVLAVERQYAKGLENLVIELTKAGKPIEATRVRAQLDALIKEIQARKTKDTVPQTAAGKKPGTEEKFEIAKGMKVIFCWIPPGEFMMGCAPTEPDGDKIPLHKVKITKGFWMAKTELTSAQWEAVMGDRPAHHQGDDRPVEKVNWFDICGNAERSGGFLAKASARAPKGWKFDLPTEAEWEYACRAGTSTSLNSGENLAVTDGVCRKSDKVAWYDKNSEGGTQPVGKKRPNNWGLHDMHGNVWEWCADWKGASETEPVTDPKGPSNGSERTFRGGSWRHSPDTLRSGARSAFRPDFRYLTLGFRPVLRETAADGDKES